MKANNIIFSLLVLLLSGCLEKDNLADEARKDTVTYVIRKGTHAVEGEHFKLLRTDVLHCEVVFDSSAVYQSEISINQLDVNKLIGFSDCNDNHHQNSARLGWTWNGQAVSLYAYAYVNGERVIRPLADFPLNQPIKCSVKAAADKYYFSAGNITDSIQRHCNGYSGMRYKLFPYFGGDELAPHDVTIMSREW
jgi:hypothetical protein